MTDSSSDDEEIEEMYAGIEELMKFTNPHENLIVMEDFNAIVGEGKEEREVGKFGWGKRNDRKERILRVNKVFRRDWGLVITNTRFQNYKKRRYTRKIPNDIDLFQKNYKLVKNRFEN